MELFSFLMIGTLAMISVMLLERIDCKLPAWKAIVISILLMFAGLAGAKLMRFIEAGTFSGESFYGAVFFAPIAMILAAFVIRVPVNVVLDMCAPAECIMLAVLKVNCLIQGCCGGRIYEISAKSFVFPAQLAELFNGIILMFVLLIMIRYQNNRGKIYPWYMIIYGATPFVWIVPAGNFWSLISLLAGIAWLCILKRCFKKNVFQKA